MTTASVKRRLAAIMSADVKDYSVLMRHDEAATVQTLTAYRTVMSELIQQHYGRVVDSPGDNLLAEFASVVDAVQSAVAVQRELKRRNGQLPEDRRMLFRLGINLGDVIVEGERIYGDGINIAARLESLAEPGGICISRTAYDQIEDKLPLGYEYLGERQVKNIPKPVRAYKVLLEPEDIAPDLRRPEEEETRAGRGESERVKVEREAKTGADLKDLFLVNLRKYVTVVLILFVINLLVSRHNLWFHWIAIGWGLLLLLHWIRRYEAARRPKLAGAVGAAAPEAEMPGGRACLRRRYIRIQIEPKAGGAGHERRVNVRVPVGLLRTGVKLSSILPEQAREKINQTMRERGLDMDLASLDDQKLEELLDYLAKMGLEVDAEDKKIRIYCD